MERKGMDREMKKRGREGKDNTEHSLEKSAKRQDGDDHGDNMRLEDESISLQVFDFPWLKDGMISESSEEEWNIEDSFSSIFLKDNDILEFCDQCLYESAATCAASLEKLEDISGWGLDMESVDSIWNSFLNQPLEGA